MITVISLNPSIDRTLTVDTLRPGCTNRAIASRADAGGKGINDPALVSSNVLTEDAVQIHTVEGKQIIAITVPKATPAQRPVYIGSDPYSGSYYRCGEGDYRRTFRK